MEDPQKIKNRATIKPNNSTSEYPLKKKKNTIEGQIPYDFTYMESKKQPYEQIKQKQTHEHPEQADGCQMERGWRKGQKK